MVSTVKFGPMDRRRAFNSKARLGPWTQQGDLIHSLQIVGLSPIAYVVGTRTKQDRKSRIQSNLLTSSGPEKYGDLS